MPEYLCRPEVSQLFAWQISDLSWDQSSATGSKLWLPAGRDIDQTNRMIISIDQQVLCDQLGNLPQTDLSHTSLYSEIADRLFSYHGSFGIRTDFTLNVTTQALEMSAKPTIMLQSPGQDNRPVVLRAPLNEKNRAKTVTSIKQQVARDIMEQFGIFDEKSRKVVLAGGMGRKKLNDLNEQSKAALAGLIYKNCIKFVELPMQARISRKRDLNLRQKLWFEVTAISPNCPGRATHESNEEERDRSIGNR